MEKALQPHTHIKTDSITHTHTVAARDAEFKGHVLAGNHCFSAIISRLME